MKNSLLNEKSFAWRSEKGHILRIIIKTDGVTADIASNVKHSMAIKDVCCVKINFADLNTLGRSNFILFLRKICKKSIFFEGLSSVIAKCDCKYPLSKNTARFRAVSHRIRRIYD